ncbi:MAG: ATP-binding protein [Clostridia bacterium]|nr:ATP-binding protein [Clostridia bacterium]
MSKKLIISSDVKNWNKIYEFINKYFTENNLPKKMIFGILVSSEEIFSNIIRHSRSKIHDEIIISVENNHSAKMVSLVFKYGGVEFNPIDADSPDVSVPLDKREIGGLGLVIVKNFIDDISYTYLEGKNILKISKKVVDF